MKRRLLRHLQKEEFDIVILVSQPNVIYASEFEVPYFGGFMSDMAASVPMVTAVIDVKNEKIDLIASDFYRSKLEREGLGEKTEFFPCFSHMACYNPMENYEKSLESVLMKNGKCNKIGIEYSAAPYCLVRAVKKIWPEVVIENAGPSVEAARRIKTEKEIELIEKAALAADAAQNRLVELSKEPGDYTELDIWFEVQKSVAKVTGRMDAFYGELVTGPRTGLSDYPLGPTDRKIEKGDIAIMDVGPRVAGYWSDCSNTAVFWKEPNEEQLKYFKAVRAAYDAGRDLIKPGKTFKEVTGVMEQVYKAHGFSLGSYLGHQIGVNVNETPRFTLWEEAALEENMVVCIEPQLYTGSAGSTGVRLERMLHVTKDGAKELNRFKWGIETD